MRSILYCLTLSSVVFLTACGKEAGRVPFTSEGTADASMTLKAGEVSFWTDIDIEYEGAASLSYQVELKQGGKVVATARCNPLGRIAVKMSWTETNFGKKHSRRGSGKMACSAKLADGGATEVSSTLAFAVKPEVLKLGKADLVVKQ